MSVSLLARPLLLLLALHSVFLYAFQIIPDLSARHTEVAYKSLDVEGMLGLGSSYTSLGLPSESAYFPA